MEMIKIARTIELTCIICGQKKNTAQFNKHKNKMISEKFGVCRDCTKIIDIHDDGEVIDMLQLLNRPYLYELVDEMRENKRTFSDYLRRIGRRKDLFKDSQFREQTLGPNSASAESLMKDFELTNEIQLRWGIGLKKERYFEYEEAFKNLKALKEPTNEFEFRRYIQNVKMGISLNDALTEGDAKVIASAQKTYNDDLKQLGLNEIMSRDDKEESLGERIKRWEEHAPVPTVSEELQDVDNISKYIKKWFIIPMKRVLGLASEEEVASLYDEV